MPRQIDAAFDAGGPHVDVTVGERAGDDAVVVVGIALRLHQGHAAAGRAALEIRVLRAAIVERLHELLALQRHLVGGAVAEVDHLLRVADGPRAALILVSGVGAGGRVAEAQRLRHLVRQPLNRSGEPAVADPHELAVPLPGRRQPHLHVDQRVGRRLQHDLHAAVRGNRRWRTCRGGRRRSRSATSRGTAGACRCRSFRHHRGGCDGGLVELEADETLAGSGGRGGAEQYENDAADHGTPPGRATRHGSRSVPQSGLLPYRSLTVV